MQVRRMRSSVSCWRMSNSLRCNLEENPWKRYSGYLPWQEFIISFGVRDGWLEASRALRRRVVDINPEARKIAFRSRRRWGGPEREALGQAHRCDCNSERNNLSSCLRLYA